MSESRNAILSKVNTAVARSGKADAAAARARLETPPPQLVPAIARPAPGDRLEVFAAKAMELGCTVARVGSLEDAPAAIAAWLTEHDEPPSVVLAEDDSLGALGWQAAGLATATGTDPARLDGAAAVTRARAGVAETGAVAVASGTAYPVSLGLLPDRHAIVLKESEIVGGYEDVWALARAGRDNQGMTRALIFVGGPSRTADIEATLVMGAHGPRAVHVVIAAG